ncbi:MAG TPA: ATP-binding protein [Chitinophagaceae bacterium]|nr:ATP-binding protein [Chitinophagaceae bacterium]
MQVSELIRILIVDDDEDDFVITSSLIRDIPNGNFTIEWCPKHTDALKKICNKEYDIYFIDNFLGGITGMELLVKAIACNTDSPMILLTGKGNRDIALQALDSGAADYLIKSELNTEKLERCIRYSLEKAMALKQLRDNEQKFRTIFEQTRDAIFIANQDLQLQGANKAMEVLLGYSSEEIRQLNLYDLLADEENVDTIKKTLAASHEVNDMEVDFQHQSGELLNCIFSATIITRPDNTKYIQGALHDITKLKKAERSVLMSEKLAATGRLARTLAHEIRNPLTNINLSVDHLKGMEYTDFQQHYFDIISRNSKRINDILTELLASSKPAHTEMQDYILQDILDKSIHAAMDRIMLKHIKLQVRYADKPIQIKADVDQLTLAFLNLIINAVEAMEEDKGKLMVSVVDLVDYWEVKITDNGVGIPEESIPKLFEPYFTAKRNGMGLGLSATLNILHAHKAQVDVTSVEGVGTTFSIMFSK